MIQTIIDRETLKMDVVARDIIRANILKRLLPVIIITRLGEVFKIAL